MYLTYTSRMMEFRREGIPMGLPGLDEWHIQQTDEKAVKKAREVLSTSSSE